MFTALGCDQLEIKDTEHSDDSVVQKVRRIESSALEDQIKVDVRGTDPEKYAVQFSWPTLQDNKVLRVRLGSVLSEVLPKQTYFTHILPHAQTVTFAFDILDSSRKPERSFTKTVVIPRDFVAKSENSIISASLRIEANRVYLSDEFPITLNGNTLDIVTNELHAEKGFIQGFPEKITVSEKDGDRTIEKQVEPTAAPLNKGKMGGNLSISSKKLFGRLKIFMRGQKGGEGPKGPVTSGRGQIGTPAGVGKQMCVNDDGPDCSKPYMCFQPNLPEIMRGPASCYCEQTGSKGGTGSKGAQGTRGEKGMRGGDSGNVRISIQEYVPLEGFDPTLPQDGGNVVVVNLIPGNGGDGGPGGDGQQGGLGGPGASKPTLDNDCKGPSGDEGSRGDPGPTGPIGDNGEVGMKCIYVGSENVNECIQ